MPPQSRGGKDKEPVQRTPQRPLPPPRSDSLLGLPSPATVIFDERTPTARGNLNSSEVDDVMSPLASPEDESVYSASVEMETPDLMDRDMTLSESDDFQDHYSISAEEQSPTSSQSGSDGEQDADGTHTQDNESDEFPPLSQSTSMPRIGGPYGHSYHTLSSHPSSSSLSYSNHFAPPFYNRPPNPLPPSPSLTSLLGLPLSGRTPFSLTTSTTAASTRPSTPTNLSDSEADFAQNDADALIFSSARRAPASGVPRAAPKVPTYEYYGFAVYVGSWVGFMLYVLWSYTPSPILHQMGLRYYPNRWWSLAIPSMLVMTIIYIYVALLSYNVEYLTLPMQSVECMVDEAAQIAVVDGKGRLIRPARRHQATTPVGHGSRKGSMHAAVGTAGAAGIGDFKWRNVWSEGTDAVMDIPIGGVCEVLYGEGRDEI